MNLDRFIEMHEKDYEKALNEIRKGKKESHWMWYIFPQIKGLGFSPMSQYYAIENIDEAIDYINNSYLKNHIIEISETLLSLKNNNSKSIFGKIDSLKLQSCMTLFLEVEPNIEVFQKVLDKFYGGKKDENTLEILKNN